jgi:hypothetical protein
VSANGDLYYLERYSGRIAEVTPAGDRVVLSSLKSNPASGSSVPALNGLSIAAGKIWFTSGNAL